MTPKHAPQPAAGAHTAAALAPGRAGIGLKPDHFLQVQTERPALGFFEVHAENYLVPGGPMHRHLSRIRAEYPITLHGVGMSIGGEGPLNTDHLDAVTRLVERYEPAFFSEHLAWSSHGGYFFNDLLPLPYNLGTLQRVCAHIEQVQDRMGRALLLENPSTYVRFGSSTWSEGEFLREVVHRTGCGLLLDVNNVYVSAINHGENPNAWLRSLPLARAGQIHLAGFHEDSDAAGDRLLIDTHGAPVDQAVWALFEEAVALTGPLPVLLERDNNLPTLAALLAEAQLAEDLMRAVAAAAPVRSPHRMPA